MSSQSSIPWFDDFVGVAYRYYDLRMNVVPLFTDRKDAASLWHDTIHSWVDPSIKIRFLELDDNYWFIMGSDSQKPDNWLFIVKENNNSDCKSKEFLLKTLFSIRNKERGIGKTL